MKIELIRTSEHDGEFYKITIDGFSKQCISISPETEDKDLARAEKIFEFYVENKGAFKTIKSVEV